MKSIHLFFIALLCVATSFLLLRPAPAAGQHGESTHGSKTPEVWYREFPNFIYNPIFCPIEDDDVFVVQAFASDNYGNPIKNGKHKLVLDRKGLYFYKGDIVVNYHEQQKYAKISQSPYTQSDAKLHRSYASNLIYLDDESKLRWVVGTAADAGSWLGSPVYGTKLPSGHFLQEP